MTNDALEEEIRAEITSLRAQLQTARKALERARAHIVTLGGGYNGQAYGDKIHIAVLDEIDRSLTQRN